MSTVPLSLSSPSTSPRCCASFHSIAASRRLRLRPRPRPEVAIRWRRPWTRSPPRAALVEAERAAGGGEEDDEEGRRYAVQVFQRSSPSSANLSLRRERERERDRAEDMQAEARAMARAANATVYSPQLLANKYASQPIKAFGRAAEILTALGSFAFKLVLDERRGQLEQNKRMRAKQLTKLFTRLGPTFVKVGQGLSTRPDICPPEYLEELSELQDALPTFPDADAFSCIERELGLPLDSIYSAISPYPIAAASLGQVYKDRLKYSRQLVAVKV